MTELSFGIGCDLYNGALTDDKAATLTASGCTSANHTGPSVIVINDKATRYQGGGASRHNDDDGKMYTLDTGCLHAVAFMAGQGAKARSIGAVKDGSPTLKASPSGLNQVPTVVYPAIARTLTAEGADASPCIDRGQNVVALDCRNLKGNHELSGTIQAKSNGGISLNYINPVIYDARGNGNGGTAVTLT